MQTVVTVLVGVIFSFTELHKFLLKKRTQAYAWVGDLLAWLAMRVRGECWRGGEWGAVGEWARGGKRGGGRWEPGGWG